MRGTNHRKPILLLGVGNTLQMDDGIGVHAVGRLMRMGLPNVVETIDGGIAGLDLLNLISGRKIVIVIDAVDGGMKPGTIYRFAPDDIADGPYRIESLHQIGLLETLVMARLTNDAPEQIVIIGVQPQKVDWGLALTETLADSLPDVVSAAVNEIEIALQHPAIKEQRPK